MPETRPAETVFDRETGEIIEQTFREVSDTELLVEAIDNESKEANDNSLIWYSDIDNMGVVQLREIVKMLLGRYIAEHREQIIQETSEEEIT